MSAPMKKRLTRDNETELKFRGPVENRDEAIAYLRKLDFVPVCEEADPNDLISWEEVFPEYEESELPGITLAGARYKEGMTQRELSRRTGIPQGHISEMENGKRSIGVRIAKKIGQALDIDFRVFL